MSYCASFCSCSKSTAQWGLFVTYFFIFEAMSNKHAATWMHHKHVTYILGGLTAAAWWCHAVCVWAVDDQRRGDRTQTPCIHMHTYTLLHTLFGGMINHGIFGSLRRGSEKPFELQKDFFFFSSAGFIRHYYYYYRINSCLSLLYYCCLGVFLPPPHLSEVTKKSQPSCGYCNKFNISTVGIAV